MVLPQCSRTRTGGSAHAPEQARYAGAPLLKSVGTRGAGLWSQFGPEPVLRERQFQESELKPAGPVGSGKRLRFRFVARPRRVRFRLISTERNVCCPILLQCSQKPRRCLGSTSFVGLAHSVNERRIVARAARAWRRYPRVLFLRRFMNLELRGRAGAIRRPRSSPLATIAASSRSVAITSTLGFGPTGRTWQCSMRTSTIASGRTTSTAWPPQPFARRPSYGPQSRRGWRT